MIKYKNIIIIAIPTLIILSLLFLVCLYIEPIKNNLNKNNQLENKNIIKEQKQIKKEKNEITVVILNKKFEEETKTNLQINQQIINENEQKYKTQIEKNQEYYIKINIYANVVNIYIKNNQDIYNVPYKVMVCSCRRKHT